MSAVSDATQRKNKSNWSGAITRVDILPAGREWGRAGRRAPLDDTSAARRRRGGGGGDLAVGRSSDTGWVKGRAYHCLDVRIRITTLIVSIWRRIFPWRGWWQSQVRGYRRSSLFSDQWLAAGFRCSTSAAVCAIAIAVNGSAITRLSAVRCARASPLSTCHLDVSTDILTLLLRPAIFADFSSLHALLLYANSR